MPGRLTDEQLQEIEARYLTICAHPNWSDAGAQSLSWIQQPMRDFLSGAMQDIPALLAEVKALKADKQILINQRDKAVQRLQMRSRAQEPECQP